MVPLTTLITTNNNNNNNPIYSQEEEEVGYKRFVESGDPYGGRAPDANEYRLLQLQQQQDVDNRLLGSSTSSSSSVSYLNELVYHNSLLFIVATLLLTTVLVFSFVLACMVLVGSKRRNAYKLAKLSDLASSTLKQSPQAAASSSLTLSPSPLSSSSSHNKKHDLITLEQHTECVEKERTFAFTTQSGNNNIMVNHSNNNNTSGGMKTPLKEISISLPIAKPSLNESKPQLSIAESKMKAKTLIERRGSNNSLTLNINSTKKRITLNNSSKECSELESLSKSSRVLTISDLIELTKENLNLYNEFYQIPPNYPEFSIHGTSIKNRYKTIIPNESTRVRLPVRNSDMLSSYINANLITGYKEEPRAYIAAQGPMSNTINDFWFMIWHERVSSVVMITRLVERNKTKCEYYLPESCSQPVLYESVLVTVTHINYYDDYEVRQLTLTCNNETRYIQHYWYTEWPDHNLPENPRSLIQLIKQVETVSMSTTTSPPGPILVHCSAGVGRTGCFLAISLGIRQLDAENQVDIVRLVCGMRKERGGMIQTLEQYEFIYQVLAYYSVYYRKYQHVMVSAQASQAAAAAVVNNNNNNNNTSDNNINSQLMTTTMESSMCHSPTMILPDISPTIIAHHHDDLFLPSPSPPNSFTFATN